MFKLQELDLKTSPPDSVRGTKSGRPARRWARFYRQHQVKLRGLTTLLVVAVAWEIAARTVITNKLAFAPLTTVWSAFVELVADGSLWKHSQVSLLEFGLGFGLAVLVGVIGGMALGASQVLRNYLDPFISLLYSTPFVALSPLFIVWFGIGLASKVAVVFLYAVFPILINTSTGITATDKNLLEVGRSFCASRMQVFTRILFHAALPYIVAGLRLGVARGVVAVVVAELFGASAGLGFLILESGQTFNTPTLLAVVILLAGSGLALVELFKALERKLASWRVTQLETDKDRG